jgi:hypothetical protein
MLLGIIGSCVHALFHRHGGQGTFVIPSIARLVWIAVTFKICIQEVLGSKYGWDMALLTEGFHDISQSLQANSKVVP